MTSVTVPAMARALMAGLVMATATGMVACGPTTNSAASASQQVPTAAVAVPEVIVLGMIHGEHRTSPHYGLARLRKIVERIDPDYILTEIPPARFPIAQAQFDADGTIAEPRVARFPEYVDVVFPMTRDNDFEIVPCAGWTEAMAKDRRDKLAEWKTSRAEESALVDAAMANAEASIAAEGAPDDPAFIHTDRYDALVKAGMEPYNRLFNDDLGAGGWDSINAAHYGLVVDAIEARKAPGKTFLVTFGAWHKYWLVEHLRQRDDVVVRSAAPFLEGTTE